MSVTSCSMRRVDALDLNRRADAAAEDQRLVENRGRGAQHPRHLPEPVGFGAVIRDAAALPDVDVRVRRENPVADLLLQAGHQRQGDDQRHDADGDAERGDERDDGDERLLPLGDR